MSDAEMLLLVDHQESQVAKFDGFAQERVRPHHNVDVALGYALLYAHELLAGDQAGGMSDLHRETAKALGEGAHVLTGEQGGGNYDRNLLALHGRDESSAQRHFGFSEPDISADQPIHGSAGSKLAEHRVDCGLLVLGLFVWKTGAELIVRSRLKGKARCFAQLPLRCDLDQLARDLPDPGPHARLARF